jgi:lipooligosaccharide transport system permease protein
VIAPPRLHMALRVWQHHARVFLKLWRGELLPPFLDPVIYFLAIGFGLGTYVSSIDGVPFRDFVAPGLCASAALWGASFEATFGFFWRMNQIGVHANMLATPIEPEDIVLGELLWAATRAAVYASAFLIAIAAMGYIHSPWALALPPFLFLGGLAFAAIGLAYAVSISKMDFFTFYFTLVVNPMFLFGGIFFPVDSLPGWAQQIAWFLPMQHVVAITRTLAGGGGDVGTVAADAAWLLVATAIVLLVPLWRLRRRLVA